MHVVLVLLISALSLTSQQTIDTSAKFRQPVSVGEKVTVTVTAASSRSREAFAKTEKQVIVIDVRFNAKDFIGLTLEPSSDQDKSNIVLSLGTTTMAPTAIAIYDPEIT